MWLRIVHRSTMAASENASRPGRSCKRAKRPAANAQLPSASHYLGYVEENETPEMIMRKFAELDALRARAVSSSTQPSNQEACPAPMTEADMNQLFKQTSLFNVRSTIAPVRLPVDGASEQDQQEGKGCCTGEEQWGSSDHEERTSNSEHVDTSQKV